MKEIDYCLVSWAWERFGQFCGEGKRMHGLYLDEILRESGRPGDTATVKDFIHAVVLADMHDNFANWSRDW